jgi:alpha-L-rhamnosidase
MLIRAAGTHVGTGFLGTGFLGTGFLGTGFLATPYLLPVLADNGELDLAYELLMQASEPSWLAMVDRGATTMWELWNGLDADGTPAPVPEPLQQGRRRVLPPPLHGQPQPGAGRAGYGRIIIEPRPGAGLTSAATSHHGPQGLIEVQWATDGGGLQLSANVPRAPPPKSASPAGLPPSSDPELTVSLSPPAAKPLKAPSL